jgi:hypothetical protein
MAWRFLIRMTAVLAGLVGTLGLAPVAHATSPQQEMALLAGNPDLYQIARKYFPADEGAAAPRRLFRLTRDQIDSSVATLLPGLVPQSIKAVMARDPLQTNYEFADLLSLNAANIAPYAKWTTEIASRVRQSPTRVIDCAADKPDDACLAAKARAFVQRAFRGDVPTDKLAQIVKFYLDGVRSVGFAQATGELVEVVLNSPDFLYRKELDAGPNQRLGPAQLLQAVTYTIADAPPERLGLESANASAYLRTPAEAARSIQALVQSRPAREKLVRFFKAWLEIKEPGEFTISAEVFPEFKPPLEAAMLADTDRFLRTVLAGPAPTLMQITEATHAFMSKPIAQLYGEAPADPSGEKPTRLDPAKRRGVFSQPAVIASHSGPAGTRPIKRGVFFARKIMCMDLEPPPKEIHAELYEMRGATERQRIESATKGAACVGCHKIINPLGFFQESYDVLGRFRTAESGQPIDTSLLIDFLDEPPVATKTAVDALALLTRSAMFKQCFVRQLFRFYMGRTEEPSDDPLLRQMFMQFAHDDRQDILSMVYMLAASDRIGKRG